jgi:CRP-like cAMP-binding protein
LAWLCPLLGQEYIPMDQYLYYETDLISEVYFIQKGQAGFVLPLATNIVYINIMQGDHFGEIDFVFTAAESGLEIHEMIT